LVLRPRGSIAQIAGLSLIQINIFDPDQREQGETRLT
jgi:hypothetical protein